MQCKLKHNMTKMPLKVIFLRRASRAPVVDSCFIITFCKTA